MRPITLFLLISVFLCQSCAPQQALSSPAEGSPTMPTPSLVIDPIKQRGKTVTVSVGDVFSVSLPAGDAGGWKVDYASSVVQSLTPVENMEQPGPQGWFFRATAVGQTDIRLTSYAPPCNDPQPCPPAPPMTFVFTLDVK